MLNNAFGFPYRKMGGSRMRAIFRNKQTKQANCYNCYFAPPGFTNNVNV